MLTPVREGTWLPTYIQVAALNQLEVEFLHWVVGKPHSPWLWYEFLDDAYERFKAGPKDV